MTRETLHLPAPHIWNEEAVECLRVGGSRHGVAVQAVDVVVQTPVKLGVHAEGPCKEQAVQHSCGEILVSEPLPCQQPRTK